MSDSLDNYFELKYISNKDLLNLKFADPSRAGDNKIIDGALMVKQ